MRGRRPLIKHGFLRNKTWEGGGKTFIPLRAGSTFNFQRVRGDAGFFFHCAAAARRGAAGLRTALHWSLVTGSRFAGLRAIGAAESALRAGAVERIPPGRRQLSEPIVRSQCIMTSDQHPVRWGGKNYASSPRRASRMDCSQTRAFSASNARLHCNASERRQAGIRSRRWNPLTLDSPQGTFEVLQFFERQSRKSGFNFGDGTHRTSTLPQSRKNSNVRAQDRGIRS